MAKSGLKHIDVGPELTKTEWESEESHELIHGTSFPGTPVERQLFYRGDEHKWYIYNGSEWVSLQGGGGMEIHGNEYHDPDFEEEGVAATLVETHRTTEVHTLDQPPDVHDNTKHSPDFATEAALATHEAATTGVHGAAAGVDILIAAVARSNFMMIPTAAGWTEVLTGAGNVRQEPMRNLVEILDVNAGSAFAYATAMGFNIGGVYGNINWDKHLYLIFNYAIVRSEAALNRRVQIEAKSPPVLGQLTAQGIGFQVIDLAITGESYGTARGTVSLGNMVLISGTNYELIQVVIELDPDTPAVKYYIDGSLAGSITNTDHIPSGLSTIGTRLKHSIDRADVGLAGVASVLFHGKIWQEF